MRDRWTGTRWRFGLALGAASLAAFGLGVACQQDEDPPPNVMSGMRPGSGDGVKDGSTTNDSGILPGSGGGTTLASGVNSPQAIALDPNNVYWTTAMGVAGVGTVGDASAGTGSVESVPRQGGSVTDVVAGLTNPLNLAVYGTTLFFTDGSSGSGALESFTTGTTVIDQVALAQSPPLPMAVNDSTLYWANGTGTALDVKSVDAATSTGAALLASVGKAYAPLTMVFQGTSLFVLASLAGDGYILEIPTEGGTGSEIWHGSGVIPADLTVGGETLYWTIGNTVTDGGEILSTPTTAGGTVITVASGLDNPAKLAIAGSTLYVTSKVENGAVLAVTTGGLVSTLASGLDYPNAIAVDDAVYFTTQTTIASVPK